MPRSSCVWACACTNPDTGHLNTLVGMTILTSLLQTFSESPAEAITPGTTRKQQARLTHHLGKRLQHRSQRLAHIAGIGNVASAQLALFDAGSCVCFGALGQLGCHLVEEGVPNHVLFQQMPRVAFQTQFSKSGLFERFVIKRKHDTKERHMPRPQPPTS